MKVTSVKHPLRAYTERLHPKGIPFSGSTYMKGSDFTQLQNSPYFCLLKYARAVKQKVWNEAEKREWDWGETLKIIFFSRPSHTLRAGELLFSGRCSLFFSPEKTDRCALNFQKVSRIGIKISFIKIAGVFGRGESTVAILAVRIDKRHAAGMELITLIMKKLCSGLSCFIINWK